MKKECNGCVETKVSKIKLDDKGSTRYAVFLNREKKPHKKHKMDGGHQDKTTLSADWMLTKADTGDIIVELKGGDVAHALEQVLKTASLVEEHNMRTGRIAALILCTQHPGIDTKIQRLMLSFTKRFKGPIHVRNRSGEFTFEHVLSFNGPEKL